MLLSKPGILRQYTKGNIIIKPFRTENLKDDPRLKTVSYDASLGHFFYREKVPTGPNPLRNPYDKKSVYDSWELCEAQPWGTIFDKYYKNIKDSNIPAEKNVFVLGPGQNALAHTEEFIGGKAEVTTSMHARSTSGRNLILVCKCAGWGDIGYTNRWTMELTNISQYYSVIIVESEPYAQIAFAQTEATDESYVGSKYQATDDIEKLIAKWTPESMLPKMWQDWGIK